MYCFVLVAPGTAVPGTFVFTTGIYYWYLLRKKKKLPGTWYHTRACALRTYNTMEIREQWGL